VPRGRRAPAAVVVALLTLAVVAVLSVILGEYGGASAPTVAVAGLAVLVAVLAGLWGRQRRLAGRLHSSQSAFQALAKSSVVLLDERLRVSFASPEAAGLIGLEPAAVVGLPLPYLVHPDDASAVVDGLTAGVDGGDGVAVRSARVRHADGRWVLVQATVRDLRDDPDVGALVLRCRAVATPPRERRGLDPALVELALSDPVTGLPNRTAVQRHLASVQRAEAGTGPAALVLVGINGLDGGQVLTEEVRAAALRGLTARLSRALRGEDWLARGKDGDFVVMVNGTVSDAEVVAARLVDTVGPIATPSGTLRLTACAGVTALHPGVDPGENLRRGDLALRSARAAGPGSVHRYDDAVRNEQTRRDALRADLDGALERGELRLVFQPVVDLLLHRTVSVEALLRWRHPVFGDVSPVEFVPLAEESPLITVLGRWVLAEACAAVSRVCDDLSVAVNVSARQVRSGELLPDVLVALESSGLPASRLVVEITESVLVDDPHVIEDLTVLRELGVRIAVDDFGTGWSSLAYLVGLPVDVLKMDQHFLANVEHDAQRQALCRAVLHLGSSLGLPVIVEGVTSEAVAELLRDMGHRYLQGYVFSVPMEAEQLANGEWRTGVRLPEALPNPSEDDVAGQATVPGPRTAAPQDTGSPEHRAVTS
jgi:diguanylate cyclase (GGDEF)-like protein/PAS domain S-box-containing protein